MVKNTIAINNPVPITVKSSFISFPDFFSSLDGINSPFPLIAGTIVPIFAINAAQMIANTFPTAEAGIIWEMIWALSAPVAPA